MNKYIYIMITTERESGSKRKRQRDEIKGVTLWNESVIGK